MIPTLEDALKEAATERHRNFLKKLIPTLEEERILGVKTPILRNMAKSLTEEYLDHLPHRYLEEDLLHVFVLNTLPLASVKEAIEAFLPYLDNWAVVDSVDPEAFYGGRSQMPYFLELARDARPYVARLGVVLALRHVDEDSLGAIESLKRIQSDHYYLQMALAWFFAEAAIRKPEAVLALLKSGTLQPSVHQKTILKLKQSRRIPDEVKKQAEALRR